MSAVASPLTLVGTARRDGAETARSKHAMRRRQKLTGARVIKASAKHNDHQGFAPRVTSTRVVVEGVVAEAVTGDVRQFTATAHDRGRHAALALSTAAATAVVTHPFPSFGASSSSPTIDPFFNFNPVCPASDGVFRVGQKAALGLAGADNIENYRPLINDVLIRVRTELCVLESFVNETAIPFVKNKGIGWVLPLHETSETYLAGVVFMVGLNFILLGSTKVVAIIAIYHDLTVGLVCRGTGGLLSMATPEADAATREREFGLLIDEQSKEMKAVMMDETLEKTERTRKTKEINLKYAALMEDTKSAADLRFEKKASSPFAAARTVAGTVAVPLKIYGKASKVLRQGLEVFDTFCSRYFVAFTVTYIIVKTTHYVLFPDVFG